MSAQKTAFGSPEDWERVPPLNLVLAYGTILAQVSHLESCENCRANMQNQVPGAADSLRRAAALAHTEMRRRRFGRVSILFFERIVRKAVRLGREVHSFPLVVPAEPAGPKWQGRTVYTSRFSDN